MPVAAAGGCRMRDIYLALALMGGLSVLALVLTLAIGRHTSRRTATLLCAVIIAFVIAHVLLVSDRLWVTRVMPLSSVIVFANPLPVAAAALAGLAWRAIPGGVVRRAALLTILAALCVHRTLLPVFRREPELLGDRWHKGV